MFNITKVKKKPIDRQIKEFFQHKKDVYSHYVAKEHREWLLKFKNQTNVADVYDIKEKHLDNFADWVMQKYSSNYRQEKATSTIEQFMRHYRANKK